MAILPGRVQRNRRNSVSARRTATKTSRQEWTSERMGRDHIIEINRSLPVIQGLLDKFYRSGPLGIFGESSHRRWFKLDPASGTLSYWLPESCYVAASSRRVLQLKHLESVGVNDFHFRLFLEFRGGVAIRIQCMDAENFRIWYNMFSRYVTNAKPDKDGDVVTSDVPNN